MVYGSTPLYMEDCMLFSVLTLILIIADRYTKHLAVRFIKPVGSVEVIKNILRFSDVENRGAAFGMLRDARWVFITVTVISVAAIVWWMVFRRPESRLLRVSLLLILSGALGNLIDRVMLGYVTDMIDVAFIDFPVFNFADCCVVVGAVLFAIYVLFVYKEPEKEISLK